MKNFLSIEELSTTDINTLLEKAFNFKKTNKYPSHANNFIANLFYEPSTRTRVSFEVAQKKLNMNIINLDLANSSESKGENITDTINNLAAMGINLFVIRHKQDDLFTHLVKQCPNSKFINAGNGTKSHPSQALLDLMTIVEKKPEFQSRKIVIIGDLKHSRVANSLQQVFKKMQIKDLVLVAPKIWQPEIVHYGKLTDSLIEGLTNADVVIVLRIQKERLAREENIDFGSYKNEYALTASKISLAKPDAIIMHPGPMNRGLEIEDEVADGPQSCILQQVSNSVYMRMAIIDSLLKMI